MLKHIKVEILNRLLNIKFNISTPFGRGCIYQSLCSLILFYSIEECSVPSTLPPLGRRRAPFLWESQNAPSRT